MPFSPAIVPETESTSWKRSRPSLKKFRMSHDTVGNPGGAPAHWPALTEASGPPAPAMPSLRTPGSDWANAVPVRNSEASNSETEMSLTAFIKFLLKVLMFSFLFLGSLHLSVGVHRHTYPAGPN